MLVATILDMFLKCTKDCFFINLHLSFKISNALSTHIMIKDWIKFQFASFPNNAFFHSYMDNTSKASPDTQLIVYTIWRKENI